MDLTPDIAVLLAVAAPFVAAGLAPWLQRAIGSWAGWVMALVPTVGFLALWPFVGDGPATASWSWAEGYGLTLSFRIDGLSLVFALTIAGIGAFVLLYAAAYLKGHPHQGRFLGFMLAFTGAMQGLVLADSIIALYAFWELTTVASFLLIGFDHARVVARRAAVQALVVTTIGGFALLVAAILLQRITGSWELSAVLAHQGLAAHGAYPVLLGLVLLAAFTKSAQLPFHFWLPNAMEAPTPVSAFLHSATMVQGGVYLLARLNPGLGGTELWSGLLIGFGGATLLWGGLAALRQTDLKLMLAQTTLASLGLMVLLIGVGSEAALGAASAYFVAHALYKAALFLVVGGIDHGTGTRDLTVLGGLREPMAATFIAALLAAAAMVGLPPLVGWFAKEEVYLALSAGDWQAIAILVAVIAGNAMLVAVGLAVAIRPFLGETLPTPKPPHEAPAAMLAGPLVFGALGILGGIGISWVGTALLAPAATAMAGAPATNHLALGLDPTSLLFWLSVATWVLGGLLLLRLDVARTLLRRVERTIGWNFDRGFDGLMMALVRASGAVTRWLHHGRLELYLVLLFAALALALVGPLFAFRGWPLLPAPPDLTAYEWGLVAITLIGVGAVVMARTRLFAILALGVQGLGVAMLFLVFGAPDLAFTQFMVEVLSVVILALVMTRLNLTREDSREFEDLVRDGGIALLCGIGVTLVLFAVLQQPFDGRLAEFFNANSVEAAHGRNIVNVILVDFRALDTLGEITVVMTAGIAILALLRNRRRREAERPVATPRRRRKAT